MERVERLVVHVDEAVRLSEARDVSRLRISLLLLDSAAELILYRESSHRLAWEEPLLQHLASFESQEKHGHKLTPRQARHREELRATTTPKAERRRIERYFDAKAEFLHKAGVLPEAYVRCLRKLHKYRNEAYHNDHVRYGSLLSAVRIYIYIVCEMMRGMTPHVVSLVGLDQLPGIRKYVGADEFDPLEVQQRVAERMLERTGLGEPEEIGHELSEHLLNRIADVEDSLKFIADHLNDIHFGEESWNTADVLRLIQGEGQLSPFASLQEVRSITVPIDSSAIERWRLDASRTAEDPDALTAFSRFADIEDAFEVIEQKVVEAATAVDHEIQLQIDIARGK